MNYDKYSGQICFTDGAICYQSACINWTIALSGVKLIGEYTTANGPHIDDYFIVFMTSAENGWHEASFYAKGRDETLALISRNLGNPIEPALCNLTDYKTRIMWPPDIMDQPLMTIIPKRTWYGRLWAQITGTNNITLSEQAKSVFIK